LTEDELDMEEIERESQKMIENLSGRDREEGFEEMIGTLVQHDGKEFDKMLDTFIEKDGKEFE
jgi:hypothetical protein